jgi:hypothetical protein
MFEINALIPGRKKRTSSGWTTFNCVACHHRGHNPDRRSRGGIKFEGNSNWVVHCFNCGFKCRFILGKAIEANTRKFLNWCGVDEEVILKWSLESLKYKDIMDFIEPEETQTKVAKLKFDKSELPSNALRIDPNDSDFTYYTNYIKSRCLDFDKYEFYATPFDPIARNKDRIITPFYQDRKLVGYTSRYLDGEKSKPKFIHEKPQGYLYNLDKQDKDWQIVIVSEGLYDAQVLDGVATLHETISPEQAHQLYRLNRKVIYVPDQDKTGISSIEQVLEYGFNVSVPLWGDHVKDINDAVKTYGRLPTLLSIIESATMNSIKIQSALKNVHKKIKKNK